MDDRSSQKALLRRWPQPSPATAVTGGESGQQFFDDSSLAFFVLTSGGFFHWTNAAWTRSFGWTEDDLQGEPCLNFIHPEDRDCFDTAITPPVDRAANSSLLARFRDRQGGYHLLEWSMEPNAIGLLQGLARQFTRSETTDGAAERARAQLEQRYARLANDWQAGSPADCKLPVAVGEAHITTDSKGVITGLNRVAEQLTGWALDAARGLPLDHVLSLHRPSAGEKIPNPGLEALRSGAPSTLTEPAHIVRKNGLHVPVELAAAPVFNGTGQPAGAVSVFFDVSCTRDLAERVRHSATHDDLTGLLNRSEFEERLNHVLAAASPPPHALLQLDLDRFRIINDSCGHVAGDELLRQVAGELQLQIRPRDTLARLGSDEFVLLLEKCTPEQAHRKACDIQSFIRNFRFSWGDSSFQIGMSIGIALIDEQATSSRRILEHAESACAMAKEAGRDRIYVFDKGDKHDQHQSTYRYWVTKVTEALETDKIELMAQPIVAIQTGEEKGSHFEVLARLRDDDGNMIPPASFINAAERYNLMPRLDRYVVSKVFRWLADNPAAVVDLDICSINLSASTLGDDRFPGFLKELVRRYRIPTHKVCFEITETMAIRNLSKTIELAAEFKRLGFLFSLDDFGSGFASYHYLKRLPVDFLKIDGEFVRGILEDPMDEAMVRSMNEIGHIMGKKTIAEYVESQPLLEKLKHIGVDYVQGFTIGEPNHLLVMH
ncbi:bifunctional diguanylate cyclase/phosphodiesterase [Hydrocarboniclastica marina]|uniref:EAL domain-containing protein n=1 Tax=Hydrocarboniclastica marina TaxID=2259620 RepID=A0A4P7XE82_9ALTE|nr:EAL domain-containing protein [Hydrocarboniclastica marina]QCF25229.1 EAL domain-containing protein [Hydrocarboniclastica marina]